MSQVTSMEEVGPCTAVRTSASRTHPRRENGSSSYCMPPESIFEKSRTSLTMWSRLRADRWTVEMYSS